MTPIDSVLMLHIDDKLDYDTLKRTCATGHSRIPVYEEVEMYPLAARSGMSASATDDNAVDTRTRGKGALDSKAKRIIVSLLVKQCVLLDPEGDCSLWICLPH